MNDSILNGIQAREYNRAQAMQLLFEQNKDITLLSAPFNTEVNLFFNNNKQLQAYIPAKNENGKGITEDKKVLKKDVAEAAAYVCSMTTAYAIKTGDNNLKNSVDYTQAVIEKMKDGDIFGFVTFLTGIVTPLLSIDDFSTAYSITADTLAQLTELATNFNSNIGKAALVNTNSGIASRNIDEVLTAIRANVVQFDLLIAFFKKKHPGFVEAYRKAVVIHDTGIHHSGIKGTIKNNNGAWVEGATLTLKGKKKTKNVTTNNKGEYELIRFLSGKAKLTITAPDCEPINTEVTIIRGKITELDFALQYQVIEFQTA